jgi:GT2 family glycosyltransferase
MIKFEWGMKFSLIIPVAPYRDAEILRSINDLDFSRKNYEVIVEKGTNASENRNRGFAKSKGEIIVFLDDDGVIEEDLLNRAEKFFKKYPYIDIVGGPQLTPLDEKGFAKISGYALSSKFGGWNTSNRYEKKKLNLNSDETSLTTAIMFCKRKVMEKIKFDVNLWPGEDPKFISDAKKENFKIAYSPDLIIYHRRRPTVRALIKQIFNYGRVAPLREKFSDTVKKPFFLVPTLFILYLTVLFILAMLKLTEIFYFIPLILYLILDIEVFSIYESIKNRDLRGIFLLPFIFPMIHLSYGTGWIYGSWQKFFKNRV